MKEDFLPPSEVEHFDRDLTIRPDGVVLVGDVAEGTGLPPQVVVRQLDQIRTEAAIRTPAVSNNSYLAGAGIVALLVGIWFIWQRSHPAETRIVWANQDLVQSSQRPIQQRQRPQPIFLPSNDISTEGDPVPEGLTVHAVEESTYYVKRGSFPQPVMKPIAYGIEAAQMERATISTVRDLEDPRRMSRPPYSPPNRQSIRPDATVRDLASVVFQLKPQSTHISLEGWPGVTEFWVPAPLTTVGEAVIHSEVEKFFEEARQTQNAALETNVDPAAGVLSPPPGYRIEFAGRRLDVQEGPRLAFADISEAQYAERIVLAVRNAFERDHRPPIGRWNVKPEIDRKTPIPKTSTVKMGRGPDAESFDLPTSANWTQEDTRLVEDRAKNWAMKVVKELADNGRNPNNH